MMWHVSRPTKESISNCPKMPFGVMIRIATIIHPKPRLEPLFNGQEEEEGRSVASSAALAQASNLAPPDKPSRRASERPPDWLRSEKGD